MYPNKFIQYDEQRIYILNTLFNLPGELFYLLLFDIAVSYSFSLTKPFSQFSLSGPGLLITSYEYGYLCLQCFNT